MLLRGGFFIIIHRLEKQNVFHRKILSTFLEMFSHRNEYQEYFLVGKGGWCIGLTTLPPSCADCLEIWGLSLLEPPEPVQACNGIALPFYVLMVTRYR